MQRVIRVKPLTRQDFEPFGDINAADGEGEAVTLSCGKVVCGAGEIKAEPGRGIISYPWTTRGCN